MRFIFWAISFRQKNTFQVDDANDVDDLNKLLERVGEDKTRHFVEFDQNFGRGDLMAAKSTLIVLRYYISLETSIKNKLRN